MVMTPEELLAVERTGREAAVVLAGLAKPWGHLPVPAAASHVPALCAEVRACWAAIHDLRQDSEAYRRAIVDAVRLLAGVCDRLPSGEGWAELKEAAAEVSDLALTRDEFACVWDGDPVPTGVVYDAREGFRGRVYDADTGEDLTPQQVVRACPGGGWYETVRAEGRQLVTERHWRNVRVEADGAKEGVTG